MDRVSWWIVTALGILALTSVPARSEPETPVPDAELLLDLDLLSEAGSARDVKLLPQLGLAERLSLVERLKLLESAVPIATPPKEVK